MAFKNAQKSRVIVGQTSFSGYTRTVETGITVDMLETTTLVDTAKAFIPGQSDASFSLGLILDTDTTANGEWDRATTWKSATPVAVTYGPSGLAALDEVFLIGALEASFSTSSTVSGTVDAAITAQPDGGADAGISLSDLEAVTVDGNGTARDLTAASTNGGVGHLHVTAFSGLTSNDITIEDSADGSTGWATILTFTQVTGLTSQRLAITGTVRRYLRVVDNVTGVGSCTRQVSFARR